MQFGETIYELLGLFSDKGMSSSDYKEILLYLKTFKNYKCGSMKIVAV